MIGLLAMAAAVASKGDVKIYGADRLATCSAWVAERREHRSQFNQAWLTGFISGKNWFGPGLGNPNPDVDVEALFAFVDNHCATHPLDNMVQAAMALSAELDHRAR